LLEKAGRLLGYKTDIIPRNVKGCEECGFCVYGCVFGAKQSTVKTYLQDAYECGAKIIVNAHVDRIIHERGVVKGAYVTVHDNEITYQVYVRAKVVVIAAGAIHTPALLMRSGLTNPNLGNHLHLHPTVPTFAFYDEPTMSWRGPHQSRLINEFVNLDRRGYGIWLETAPMHPGFAALALPWQSGRQHKHLMQHYKFLTNNIVLTRDYYGGKVKLDADGQPVLHYKLHPYDAQHMMRGMIEALRLHYATQAKEIMSPHNRYLRYQAGSSEKFEDFLTTVQRHGFHPNAYALFSAHQMSTARIGKDSTQGAIKPTGETYEVKNLFVADSSVFPTACGVNPMLTIMTTAHLITQHIKGVL
jgi:choline dehydrogenase-like flavoprotein